MAEAEKPNSPPLTKFAGIASLASFAVAAILLGIVLRLPPNYEGPNYYDHGRGFGLACSVTSFLLTLISFFSGVLALCGAKRARGLRISIALAGIIFSASLFFWGKTLYF